MISKMIWFLSFWKLSLKRFDKWLFGLLLLRLLIPAIYINVRVSILGSLSNKNSAYKVVSQLTWVQIALEVFEEALLLPLYHCFGSAVHDNESLRGRFRSGLSVCLVFYAVFLGIIGSCTSQLVKLMAQEKDLIKETTIYLRLELGSIFADGIGKFSDLFLVVKKKKLLLMIKLIIQMLCSILFDIFFFSNLSVSLQLGIKGVAYSSMARSFITLFVGIVMSFFTIRMSPKHFFTFRIQDYSWLKVWTIQGLFSGLDSLIRNSVYALIVIRGMNLLNEQGTYWIANNFIWSWLLIPVSALSEMLRQDVATNHPQQSYQSILPAYMFLVLVVLIIWAVTVPAWKPFIANVMKASKPLDVANLVYQLMPGYISFIISSLARAVFYAKGKIQFIVISSTVASVVLVSLFLMMIYGVFPSNVKVVAGIFETNMIAGSIAAIVLVVRFIRISNSHVSVLSVDDNCGSVNSEKSVAPPLNGGGDCVKGESSKEIEKEPLNQKKE